MKTKLLILAALVFVGLTFSSCTKDNSLTDETSSQQTENLKTEWNPHNADLAPDMISNAPDPFENYTTISYIVRKAGVVKLSVHKEGQGFATVLVNEKYQRPGKYTVTFDATGIPFGKYIAVLTISTELYSAIYEEEMTKNARQHQDDESAVTD